MDTEDEGVDYALDVKVVEITSLDLDELLVESVCINITKLNLEDHGSHEV